MSLSDKKTVKSLRYPVYTGKNFFKFTNVFSYLVIYLHLDMDGAHLNPDNPKNVIHVIVRNLVKHGLAFAFAYEQANHGINLL